MPLNKDALETLRMNRDEAEAGARSRARPWAIAAAAAAAIVAGLSWQLFRPGAVAVETALARETAQQAARAGGTVLNASGYVVARRVATVASKTTGQVAEVLVEEGMAVDEGQVLARLDDTNARAEVALTESRLDNARRAQDEVQVRLEEARRTLARAGALREQGLVSQAELDTAEADVAALEARLALALGEARTAERALALSQRLLDDTIIRAPFAGVVVSKDAQPGETISPVSAGGGFTRTGIATIVDMDSLEIEVDVNEAFINRVRQGQPAEAVLDAYPDWRIPASVISIVPTADRQKATVKVRIGFEEFDPRILPEMGVQVWFLEQAGPADGAAEYGRTVSIPQGALRGETGSQYVFVVRDGRAERRMVQVGQRRGGEIEVLAGLAGGETVVTRAAGELADGARVAQGRKTR